MKIAQVVSLAESVPPQSKNGLEFVVSWLTEELVKRGHQITLFAPANSKTKAKLVSLFPQGISREEWLIWSKKNYSDWNTSLVASMSQKFDLIHSHTGTIFQFIPFINCPVVYTIHEPYNDNLRKKYLSQQRYKKYIKFIINQYKKVHYVNISQKQARDFIHCQHYYFKNHTTIYNGIPVKKFSFNNQPQDYLLYLGYINKDKGADLAIKIAQQSKMKLILAGGIIGQEDFYKYKIKPYLNRRIKYIGPVDFKQKNELYKNALATLTPLRWHEPFGLTLIESQACGTPVIAFNRGAARELIKNNKTGFVVEGVTQAIESIKKIDSIKRKECRDWTENKFSVERMVDEYENLYKKYIQPNKQTAIL